MSAERGRDRRNQSSDGKRRGMLTLKFDKRAGGYVLPLKFLSDVVIKVPEGLSATGYSVIWAFNETQTTLGLVQTKDVPTTGLAKIDELVKFQQARFVIPQMKKEDDKSKDSEVPAKLAFAFSKGEIKDLALAPDYSSSMGEAKVREANIDKLLSSLSSYVPATDVEKKLKSYLGYCAGKAAEANLDFLRSKFKSSESTKKKFLEICLDSGIPKYVVDRFITAACPIPPTGIRSLFFPTEVRKGLRLTIAELRHDMVWEILKSAQLHTYMKWIRPLVKDDDLLAKAAHVSVFEIENIAIKKLLTDEVLWVPPYLDWHEAVQMRVSMRFTAQGPLQKLAEGLYGYLTGTVPDSYDVHSYWKELIDGKPMNPASGFQPYVQQAKERPVKDAAMLLHYTGEKFLSWSGITAESAIYTDLRTALGAIKVKAPSTLEEKKKMNSFLKGEIDEKTQDPGLVAEYLLVDKKTSKTPSQAGGKVPIIFGKDAVPYGSVPKTLSLTKVDDHKVEKTTQIELDRISSILKIDTEIKEYKVFLESYRSAFVKERKEEVRTGAVHTLHPVSQAFIKKLAQNTPKAKRVRAKIINYLGSFSCQALQDAAARLIESGKSLSDEEIDAEVQRMDYGAVEVSDESDGTIPLE